MASGRQPLRHFPAPIERRPCILLVQQPHEQKVLVALPHRLVIQPRAIDAPQLALPPHTDLRAAPLHQRPHLLNRACRLFFLASSVPPSDAQSLRRARRCRLPRSAPCASARPRTAPAVAPVRTSSTSQSGWDAP